MHGRENELHFPCKKSCCDICRKLKACSCCLAPEDIIGCDAPRLRGPPWLVTARLLYPLSSWVLAPGFPPCLCPVTKAHDSLQIPWEGVSPGTEVTPETGKVTGGIESAGGAYGDQDRPRESIVGCKSVTSLLGSSFYTSTNIT